ncbi:ATP-grasp domain-containing protein, partial [Streptomyces sp. IF17]|nr:ATP-grasp domain-containing protein [Streptomyces alkaliphilus]
MGSLDTAVPALLFRLDRNPFHHGSLGAARSLGRAGVRVHAFTESVHGPLASSRHVRRVYPMPSPASGSPPSLDTIERVLDRVAGRIGRPAVLIPMDDAAAVAADLLAGELADRFLLPGGGSVTGLPERLADKAELVGLCRELNLPHPDTYA